MLERERDKERNNENETSLKGENERDDKRRRAQAAQVSHAGTNKSQLKSSNKSGASSTLKRTVRSKHHDGSEVDNDDGLFDSNSSSASQSHSTSPVTSKSKRNRVSIYETFNYDHKYSNIIGDTRTSLDIDNRLWSIVM